MCSGSLAALIRLLGKLSTHEFAIGGPSFDLAWASARNPWNTDHHPDGSSSGSGSGLAAGLVPMALGSDTGGSVRNPASACEIVGLKPTYGLVSRRGVLTVPGYRGRSASRRSRPPWDPREDAKTPQKLSAFCFFFSYVNWVTHRDCSKRSNVLSGHTSEL
jgi:hypothetical protein